MASNEERTLTNNTYARIHCSLLVTFSFIYFFLHQFRQSKMLRFQAENIYSKHCCQTYSSDLCNVCVIHQFSNLFGLFVDPCETQIFTTIWKCSFDGTKSSASISFMVHLKHISIQSNECQIFCDWADSHFKLVHAVSGENWDARNNSKIFSPISLQTRI